MACFLLFGALLVWPLLAIPNRPVLVLGVPASCSTCSRCGRPSSRSCSAWPGAARRPRTSRERPGRPTRARRRPPRLPRIPVPGRVAGRGLRAPARPGPRRGTATYVLAVSVYCTAWTFYGSVGLAANRGLEFLTIYLGPALRRSAVAGRAAQARPGGQGAAHHHHLRLHREPLREVGAPRRPGGRSRRVRHDSLHRAPAEGGVVSFRMMLRRGLRPLRLRSRPCSWPAPSRSSAILFGARNLDFTRRQTGLMTAVAVESIVKLVAFLVVGAYVTWGLFGGFGDIFGRVAAHPGWSRLLVLDPPPPRPTRGGRPCC